MRRKGTGFAIALALGLIAAVVTYGLGGVAPFDGWLFDRALGLRAALLTSDREPDRHVAVIAVDPASLASDELAGTPRALFQPVWAKLIETLVAADAKVVAFDFVFLFSGNRMTPGYDTPFLRALSQHREKVVLGRSGPTPPLRPYQAALRFDEGGWGLLEVDPDVDGVFRRVQTRHRTGGEGMALGLSGAALRRAGVGMPPDEILLAPDRHLEALRSYALVDLLRCAGDDPTKLRPLFAGRLVFVGTTLPEEDRKLSSSRFMRPAQAAKAGDAAACPPPPLAASVPRSRTTPGVYLHAWAAAAVLSGHPVDTARPSLRAATAGATGLAGTLFGLTLAPWVAVAATLLLGAGLWLAEAGLLGQQLWLPVGMPMLAALACMVVSYLGRYFLVERSRQRITEAFGRYLAPAFVQTLADDPSHLQLGGETRELTMLFCDLRGFTTISETFKSSPQELTRLINRLLTPLSNVVMEHEGTIDKYIGDCVMAFWNAPIDVPDHAVKACDSALAMLAALARLNDELEAEARAQGRPFKHLAVGTGINTGEVVVGNMGSERRLEYSVLGDAVNLASRLEGQSKAYGVSVLLGAATQAKVPDYATLELDLLAIKGKQEAIRIHALLGDPQRARSEGFQRLRARHADFLAAYRGRDWAAARAIAGECRAMEPAMAGYYDMIAERLNELSANPPPAGWDGVYRAETK
ncbi:MAG: adenylate/guanylate cyclase domain-containing protein [Alphaproteobacteria bacterium]|nr:adenylate/guanylate cyclase domain-containing protein [Alphaproteobacteria bacterium]